MAIESIIPVSQNAVSAQGSPIEPATYLSPVTVIIPTFNQAHYLEEAVISALNQTVPPEAILISDDASTDDTAIIGARLSAMHPKVKFARNIRTLGIPGNNSKVMAEAQSEFVLHLDSDDVLEPQFIENLLPLIRGHPRAGYAHAAVTNIDGNGSPRHQVFLNRRAGFVAGEEALRASVAGYRVAANIVLYRRSMLVEMNYWIGGPERCSDYALSARMAAAGWGNVYSDRLLSRYRVWTDKAGVRARQKQDQLNGFIHVFDDVLTPAFTARGWATETLRRQRRRLALVHANACFLSHYSKEDRDQLIGLLQKLGDSPFLEMKMKFLRAGFAPAFEALLHLRGRIKSDVKRQLARRRVNNERKDVGISNSA
jgi:hypothetical protein